MPSKEYDNKVATSREAEEKEKAIRKWIWEMAGQYPNIRFQARHMDSYITALKIYPLDIIGRAIPRAIKTRRGNSFTSAHMPTADNIRVECRMIRLGAVSQEAIDQPVSEPEHSPNTNSNFAKLANLWAEQSKTLKLDGSEPAPAEVGKDRWETFKKTWEFSGLGRW